jgi:integrase
LISLGKCLIPEGLHVFGDAPIATGDNRFTFSGCQPVVNEMASITKLQTGRWLARVRRKGFAPLSKTFSTKTLAQQWAKTLEGDTEQLSAGQIPRGSEWTIDKVIERYEEEVEKTKTMGRNKKAVLKTLRTLLAGVQLADLTPERIVAYVRDDRKVDGVTASIDLTYLKGALKVSRALLKVPVRPTIVDDARETLNHLGLLSRSNERDRRPTAKEIEQIREWVKERSETLTVDHIDFILDSCFRPPSEIVNLRWEDLNREDRTIMIRDRKDPRKKIGNNQIVPLLGRCMEIIERQPKTGPLIFPVNGASWSSLFPRACRAYKIKNLRLYDLRHEAISRLVATNKYSILEMMLITGHKDPKQLARYTQLRAKDLHR